MAKLTLHVDESALNAVAFVAELAGETVEEFVQRCALDPMVRTCLEALQSRRLGVPMGTRKKDVDA